MYLQECNLPIDDGQLQSIVGICLKLPAPTFGAQFPSFLPLQMLVSQRDMHSDFRLRSNHEVLPTLLSPTSSFEQSSLVSHLNDMSKYIVLVLIALSALAFVAYANKPQLKIGVTVRVLRKRLPLQAGPSPHRFVLPFAPTS